MRGNSKHGYHRHRGNKHYKKQIVRVLLDNSSDGGLVFVKQRQAHVASPLKKAGSTVMEYFEWDLPN
jgi:hypothetical protein